MVENREPQIRVLRKHRAQVDKINHRLVPQPLLQAGQVVRKGGRAHVSQMNRCA